MTSSKKYDMCISSFSEDILVLKAWTKGIFMIITQAGETGGTMEDDSANLYYSPAEREDELYQQLQKQRIKSIPGSHIKYALDPSKTKC